VLVFVVDWADPAAPAMPASGVVEAVDPAADGEAGLLAGRERVSVNELGFQDAVHRSAAALSSAASRTASFAHVVSADQNDGEVSGGREGL
jgi:hypothetical protein